MTQSNDTPANGYYTHKHFDYLGIRLCGPLQDEELVNPMTPSYAVSPDLELKERMYENVDFKLWLTSAAITAHPIESTPATHPKASVEGEGRGNYYDPLFDLLHQEHGLTLLQSEMNDIIQVVRKMETADQPRSFTSKDMEALLVWAARQEFLYHVRKDEWKMDGVQLTTSELLNQFLNRDQK